MLTLSVGIGDVRLADAHHFLQYGPIFERSPTQRGPIPPFAATDDVINGGQGELLMGKMTVQHGVIPLCLGRRLTPQDAWNPQRWFLDQTYAGTNSATVCNCSLMAASAVFKS